MKGIIDRLAKYYHLQNILVIINVFLIHFLSLDELDTIAKYFYKGKAPGIDNIPNSIVKMRLISNVNYCCIFIINLSLSTGYISINLKFQVCMMMVVKYL